MRRFITLIDVLYEAHTRVVCSADVPLQSLYVVQAPQGKSGASQGEEENFAFDRTLSRLLEMQSKTYLDQHKAMLVSSQPQQ